MKAAQVDVVKRTTQLLTSFNLSTAAPELAQRLESDGHREALLLVLEVLEMEAEARECARSCGCVVPRNFRPAKPSKLSRCQHAARSADAKAARAGAR